MMSVLCTGQHAVKELRSVWERFTPSALRGDSFGSTIFRLQGRGKEGIVIGRGSMEGVSWR